METAVAYSRPIRSEYCIVFIQHNTARAVELGGFQSVAVNSVYKLHFLHFI